MAQRFMEATGLKARKSNFMYRSRRHPFMIADVDRLIVGEDAGLEGARPPAPTMQTNGRTGTYPSLVNINSDKGISVIGT